MLKFSKKVEYALISLVEMAARERHDLVTTKDLARQYDIPPEHLGKVLQNLSKSGILNSLQGVKGGYTLAAPVEEIKVKNIIEAVDGPLSISKCLIHDSGTCEQNSSCNIKTPLRIIQDELIGYFNNISLKDIKDKYMKSINLHIANY